MRAGWTDMKGSDRVLHAGAFNWSYTLGTGLFDPWSVGATALVLAKGVDHAAIPLMAKRHDATILAAVPGIYRKLLKGPLPPLPKLRHALSAGEKLPESVRSAWRDATGTDIHEAFGQTECSTFISGSPSRPAPPDTLGYAQPGRAVAIVREGMPIARGETGGIAIHRDDPGLALSAVADEGEWVETGDLGVMQPDGAITYLGRADDVLTAGGYRVAPQEVEHVFETHPGITSAAAVDHDLTPETRVIALHYTGPEALEAADLERHAADRLAAHKIPRLFLHRQSLPHGRNGKLLRGALRAEKDTAS
jgi:acyl-coenzyme A synthetase/AMP-(fatty) acid ligase